MKNIAILIYLIAALIDRSKANEYWADGNGAPENYDSASDAAASEHADAAAEGEEHAGGADEAAPPGPVDVQDGEGQADATTTQSPCQFNELVKCLTEPLDEWAVALYKLKENIVAITSEECLHSREMIRQCIEEKAPSLGCDHANILAVAERVTDLLVHKKKSGSLLRSYYVTAYVCTEEGRGFRDAVGEQCLKQEHLGEMLFDAIKYMDEKISHNHTANGEQLCKFLRERSELMRDIGEQKCTEHSEKAGRLMCEAVKIAFLTMYQEKFKDCKFECHRGGAPTADTGGGGEAQPTDGAAGNGQTGANHGKPPTADGADGSSNSANIVRARNYIFSFLALTSAALCRLFQRTLCL